MVNHINLLIQIHFSALLDALDQVDLPFNLRLDLIYLALDSLNRSVRILVLGALVLLLNGSGLLGVLFTLNEELLDLLPALVTKDAHGKLQVGEFFVRPSAHSVEGILWELETGVRC